MMNVQSWIHVSLCESERLFVYQVDRSFHMGWGLPEVHNREALMTHKMWCECFI